MSLVNRKWPRSLVVAILAFVLSLGGVTFASAAQAVSPTTGQVVVLCDEAQDGSATLFVQDVSPEDAYYVVMMYEGGYNRVETVVVDAPVSFALFGPYGEPIGLEGDNAQIVDIALVSNDPAYGSSEPVRFDRDPQCGARPNRPPVASDLTSSGSRYDDSIVVQIAGAYDLDADPLGYSLVGNPAHGTAEVTGVSDEQRTLYPDAQALIVYHPNGVYLGNEVVTYQVSDGRGGVDTATATVAVTDSTPVNASPPTFVPASRQNSSAQVVVPSTPGVRYQLESSVIGEYDASGGTYSVPQGTTVTVTAFATQPGTTLVGTKSWQTTFAYLLSVTIKDSLGRLYYNKVRVYNRNAFGAWFRHGDLTAPSMKQDGRVWVAAGKAVFVPTSRKVLDWSATGSSSWTDASRLTTAQIRPSGRISYDCAGSRKGVKFYMNNYASNKTVKFEFVVNNNYHQFKSVAGGSAYTAVYRWRGLRPGQPVRLVAHLPWGKVTLASARLPSACS